MEQRGANDYIIKQWGIRCHYSGHVLQIVSVLIVAKLRRDPTNSVLVSATLKIFIKFASEEIFLKTTG